MSATVKAEVWRVIVRFVFALGAIVCLAGFGAPLVFGSEAVEGKLCCDETCSQPISYGRTVTRFISKSKDYLSFPGSAIVTIVAKNVGQEVEGEEGEPVEMWEAEIQGKRGLIRKDMVKEISHSCVPKVVPSPWETVDAAHTDFASEPSPTPSQGHSHSVGENQYVAPNSITGSSNDLNLKATTVESESNSRDSRQQIDNSATNYEAHEPDRSSVGAAATPQVFEGEQESLSDDHASQRTADAGERVGETNQQREDGRQFDGPGRVPEHVHKWRQEDRGVQGDRDGGYADAESSQSREQWEGVDTPLIPAKVPEEEGSRGSVGYDGRGTPEAEETLNIVDDFPDFQHRGNLMSDTPVEAHQVHVGEGTHAEGVPDVDLGIVSEDKQIPAPKSTDEWHQSLHTFSPPEVDPSQQGRTEPSTQFSGLPESHTQDNEVREEEEHKNGFRKPADLPENESIRIVSLRNGHFGAVYLLKGDVAIIVLDDGLQMQVDYDYLFDELDMDADTFASLEDLDSLSAFHDDDYDDDETQDVAPQVTQPPSSPSLPREAEREYWNKDHLRSLFRSEVPKPTPIFEIDSPTQEEAGVEERSHVTEERVGGDSEWKGSSSHPELDQILEKLRTPEQTDDEEKSEKEEEKELNPEVSVHGGEEEWLKEGEDVRAQFEDLPWHQEASEEVASREDQPPDLSGQYPESRDTSLDEPYSAGEPPTLPSEDDIPPPQLGNEDTSTLLDQPGTGAWEMYKAGIVQFLPEPIAVWVISQGVMFPVAMVATVLCLALPMCCLCCRSRQQRAKHGQLLKEKAAALRKLKVQVDKLKEEKSSQETRLRGMEDHCNATEEDLRVERHTSAELRQTMAELEAHYQTVANSLSATQQQVEQLNRQMAHEQKQLSAQIGEKDIALLQIAQLSSQLQVSDQRVQELEAAKDQLEHDLFSTQNGLEQLQGDYETVKQEREEVQERCSSVETELQSVKEEAKALREAVMEKDQELEALRECVRSVTEKAAEGTDGGEKEEEEEGEGTGKSADFEESRRKTQLAKIQAMLDTTKAQTQLREVTEARDQLATQLQQHTTTMEELRAENSCVREQMSELERQLAEVTHNNDEAQLRLRHLTEYFEQREHSLHRKLGAEEEALQEVQTREAEAKHRADTVEQDREREREELKDLRKQMMDIEKSLKEQVLENEKRAETAYAQLRKTENDLRMANLEVTDLRKRLGRRPSPPPPRMVRPLPMDMRMPGPDARPRVGPRPPSATQFPRTSSPSLLNESQPGPRTDNSLPLPPRRPHSACETDAANGGGARPQRTSPLSEVNTHSSASPPSVRPVNDSQYDVPPGDRSLPAVLPPPSRGFRRYPPPPHRGPAPRMRPHSNPPLSELEGQLPPPPGKMAEGRRFPPFRRSPPPAPMGHPPFDQPPSRHDYPPLPRGGDRYGRPPPPRGAPRSRTGYYGPPRPPSSSSHSDPYGHPHVPGARVPPTGPFGEAPRPPPPVRHNPPPPAGLGGHTHQPRPPHQQYGQVQGYGQQMGVGQNYSPYPVHPEEDHQLPSQQSEESAEQRPEDTYSQAV